MKRLKITVCMMLAVALLIAMTAAFGASTIRTYYRAGVVARGSHVSATR